jgi:hypothetical protein
MRRGANIVIGSINAARKRCTIRRRERKGEVFHFVDPSSYSSSAGAVGCRDSGHRKIT